MEIISWSEAKKNGLHRYFNGKPCAHGHLVERRTDTRACVQCARDRAALVSKDVKRDRFAKYYKENAQKLRSLRVSRYLESGEKEKKAAKQYRSKNPDAVRAAMLQWRLKNPNYKANRRAANPEFDRVHVRNRYARKIAAEGSHTAKDILRIFSLQNGKCACCGKELRINGVVRYHVDHRMPLILGGSNSPENLQILCPTCNLRKGAKSPEEWANSLGMLL